MPSLYHSDIARIKRAFEEVMRDRDREFSRRLDLIEQAIVDPQGEAAHKLREKHGLPDLRFKKPGHKNVEKPPVAP